MVQFGVLVLRGTRPAGKYVHQVRRPVLRGSVQTKREFCNVSHCSQCQSVGQAAVFISVR